MKEYIYFKKMYANAYWFEFNDYQFMAIGDNLNKAKRIARKWLDLQNTYIKFKESKTIPDYEEIEKLEVRY